MTNFSPINSPPCELFNELNKYLDDEPENSINKASFLYEVSTTDQLDQQQQRVAAAQQVASAVQQTAAAQRTAVAVQQHPQGTTVVTGPRVAVASLQPVQPQAQQATVTFKIAFVITDRKNTSRITHTQPRQPKKTSLNAGPANLIIASCVFKHDCKDISV